MRTGDSNKRLSSLFNIPRSTMERHMNIVRLCFMEHFVPLHIGLQHLNKEDVIRRNLNGHIIDVIGPYAATQTDAEIMKDLFTDESGPMRSFYREGDVFILDRGFRDAIPLFEA
ncbi:hypothetical protein SFRURICE_006209 [Spodoptera frugiperda]|nr:hypothetical protein SFRURICE_006209 [Spodoptera frugiperda]